MGALNKSINQVRLNEAFSGPYTVMLYFGGRGIGELVCCGNTLVENSANRFLFQKANLPIFIYNGISYYTSPTQERNVFLKLISCEETCSENTIVA